MTYSEEELLPTANIMVNYILDSIPHESLYKKYAHKRYMKVSNKHAVFGCVADLCLQCSVFMRQWALERWPENAIVDLKADLSALKQEVRLARQMAKAEECDE